MVLTLIQNAPSLGAGSVMDAEQSPTKQIVLITVNILGKDIHSCSLFNLLFLSSALLMFRVKVL